MRDVQNRGSKRASSRQGSAGGEVPDVRASDTGAASDDVPGHSFATRIRCAKISSPNKVVWSRGAALSASRRRRVLRDAARIHCMAHTIVKCILPAQVTLTRVAPRAFDYDNMVAGMKPVRDGVADAFGLRDDDPGLEWIYKQERGAAREYAIVISVVAYGIA